MKYQDGVIKLSEYREKIKQIRKDMRSIQTQIEPQPVDDYSFQTIDGQINLSQLFGDKEYLYTVHNMGKKCAYCTLWADGYNGIYEHLKSKASFYISSPDTPDIQADFAKSRGWKFPMISSADNTFTYDMGYQEGSHYKPGLSVFKLINNKPYRISDVSSSPWDDFNPLWHLFDLMPDPKQEWQPRFSYDGQGA